MFKVLRLYLFRDGLADALQVWNISDRIKLLHFLGVCRLEPETIEAFSRQLRVVPDIGKKRRIHRSAQFALWIDQVTHDL